MHDYKTTTGFNNVQSFDSKQSDRGGLFDSKKLAFKPPVAGKPSVS